MKKIFLISLLSLTFMSCKAQAVVSLSNYTTNDLKSNNYIKDTNGKLNPFIGTWKWTSGNNEFTVKFIKKAMYNADGYRIDMIMGGYSYVENGVELVNTLNFTTEFNPNDSSTFAPYAKIISNISNPFDELSLQVFDKLKGKSGHGAFKLIDPLNGPNGQWMATQAQWKLWNREGMYVNGDMPPPEFSIPTDVVLTKVE